MPTPDTCCVHVSSGYENKTGVKLLNIIGSPLLISSTTSLFLFNNILNQQ